MILRTKNLARYSHEDLKRMTNALKEYIRTKPSHHNGLCYWLRREKGFEINTKMYSYDFINSLLPEYMACSLVDPECGPTPIRVAFAKRVLKAIRNHLPKDQTVKTPINFKKASRQRVFEYVLKALRKQGSFSVNASLGCEYRNEAGHGCAVGLCLTDEQVKAIPIKRGYYDNKANAEFFDGIFGKKKSEFMQDMQRNLHDCPATLVYGSFSERLESAARGFAERHGLRYTEPGVTMRS